MNRNRFRLVCLLCNVWSASNRVIIFSEPFYNGGQPDDDRIIVEESTIEAPYYTDGERRWRQSTIVIDGIRRTDDGIAFLHSLLYGIHSTATAWQVCTSARPRTKAGGSISPATSRWSSGRRSRTS